MVIENTKENKDIANVVSTLAIENMFLSEDFINELIKVSKGEKTSEQLRQEVIKKYTRQNRNLRNQIKGITKEGFNLNRYKK